MITPWLAWTAFALLSGLAVVGHAQVDAPRLTSRGRILIGGGVGGNWSNDESRGVWPRFATWQAYADPSLTYFLRDRLGLGLALGGSFAQSNHHPYVYDSKVRDSELWAGPTATLEISLASKVSWMIRPGVSYGHRWRKIPDWNPPKSQLTEASPGNDPRDDPRDLNDDAKRRAELDVHFLRFALSVPVAFHLSDSVALGFGPALWFDFFFLQHPEARTGSAQVNVGPTALDPNARDPEAGKEYRRTRFVAGAYSWLGVSF